MLAYLFVILAVAFRFLPHSFHDWNFTPVAAALLYFGARAPRKHIWMPVALLGLSDFYLTVFHYKLAWSWSYFVVILAWYTAIALLGSLLAKRENIGAITAASLTASITFFVVTNAISPWIIPGMYSHDVHGVIAALSAGVPFFRSTVVSDLLFTAVAFGTPHWISAFERRSARSRTATA